jgi:hypothetical protein
MTMLIVWVRDAAVALVESSAIAVGVVTPRTPLAVNDFLVSARRAVTILEQRLMAITNILVFHMPRWSA